MSIWSASISLDQANESAIGTLVEHLGIEFTEIGEDYMKATMPVDNRHRQPMGILNGGASVALAESLGSLAAQLVADPGNYCVGLDINANHLKSVKEGLLTAIAKPIHMGRSTQVWSINIYNSDGEIVCVSRLTMAVRKGQF